MSENQEAESLVERLRDDMARIIDPVAWAAFDKHQAAASRYIEVVGGPVGEELADALIEASHDVTEDSLAKADAIRSLLEGGGRDKDSSQSQPCGEASADAEVFAGQGTEGSAAWRPPEGWALVPIKPTEAMKLAAFGPIRDGGRHGPVTSDFLRREGALVFWAAMVAAAPQPREALGVLDDLLEALKLALGRVEMLLPAELDGSDHPTATHYVIERANTAIAKATGGAA